MPRMIHVFLYLDEKGFQLGLARNAKTLCGNGPPSGSGSRTSCAINSAPSFALCGARFLMISGNAENAPAPCCPRSARRERRVAGENSSSSPWMSSLKFSLAQRGLCRLQRPDGRVIDARVCGAAVLRLRVLQRPGLGSLPVLRCPAGRRRALLGRGNAALPRLCRALPARRARRNSRRFGRTALCGAFRCRPALDTPGLLLRCSRPMRRACRFIGLGCLFLLVAFGVFRQ